MIPAITIIFFFLGLIIGSFLNVVIYRLNTQRSFGGRSACMSCQNRLRWYELIPVFSFIGLMGRCRNCKTRISPQYPLVETVAGIIFAALFWKFQNLIFLSAMSFASAYAFYAAFFSMLLVVTVYDLKHKIIPDILSFVLGVFGFLGLFFFDQSANFYPGFHIPSVMEFLAGPILALPFALLWLVSSGRWMGLGDAKLLVSIGWILGLPLALSGATMAFWLGAIGGIILVIFGKKYGMRSEIPFAPYLALGALLAFLLELRLF